MRCPSFERLIDSLDSRLSDEEAAGITSHLGGGCPVCGETRDWYERVRAAVAIDDSIAPPQWVFNRAIRIFDKQSVAQGLHRPGLAERIAQGIAALVYDSFARPEMAGVRSTEMADRQLLYDAGDYSIDLRIAPSKRTHADVTGQVLKEGDPKFESVSSLKVQIASGDHVVFSTVTDEMGEFKISGVEWGVYSLRVQLSDGRITVPDLSVSESQLS